MNVRDRMAAFIVGIAPARYRHEVVNDLAREKVAAATPSMVANFGWITLSDGCWKGFWWGVLAGTIWGTTCGAAAIVFWATFLQ